jgi:hypothetical protein
MSTTARSVRAKQFLGFTLATILGLGISRAAFPQQQQQHCKSCQCDRLQAPGLEEAEADPQKIVSGTTTSKLS